MRKRRIFLIIAVAVISVVLMGLDVYENKKRDAALKAEAEKIYTVTDILKDADFSEDNIKLGIGIIKGNIEDYETIFIEDEEQQKQLLHHLQNLQFQISNNIYMLSDADYWMKINSDEDYYIYIFNDGKEIRLDNDTRYFNILNNDEFSDILQRAIQQSI
ncbi:hypothetical protein FC756_04525 [Lysinibacillus mangiferihumi]|uniref:Uncharacterized protein n=1 Tax=Lysinibacillus mangiferihumi TaxID=1130819 RepID=A0A4U2ZBN3_9BACI|nr:hypothetical protein [Lysinibacillus mangiferihumi]TKI71644.1 hypothetical protein FC756_04525 [Lysinibacillus mangiferihumi]